MINYRFEILKQIGKGRSEVFLCKDVDFGAAVVAVKFLPPDVSEEELRSFKDEYFTLRKLDHPNIIKAFEIGEVVKVDVDDRIKIGSNFISLEYFESDELFKYDSLREEEKLREILKQICSVLYYLHQSNYIYYDLKPENILVSSASDSLQVKLIDLGLVQYLPNESEHVIKGTAQYIAPELLKKEPHDHRVDLYSLGILLYEIIYNKLPFETRSELDIYKAQVENEFHFPESTAFSTELITIVKKLLEKDPEKRYSNALQVVYDLGFEINASVYNNFVPAKVFCGRQDIVNILNSYINDKNSSEVFTLKGFGGSGKSLLINHMYKIVPDSILINITQGISGLDLIRHIIKRIIFTRQVFTNLDDNELSLVLSFLNKSEKDFIDGLHSLLPIITSRSNFTLLIDDYNLFDKFSGEIISDLIPLLQVNGIKVIISESSDIDYTSGNINNLKELTIGSFTDRQLSDYLELAFYNLFPKNELKEIILLYADLLPGNIIEFISDLIGLQIIIFERDGVKLNEDVERLTNLEGSQSAIYDLRISNLNNDEIDAAKIISAFDNSLEQSSLASLLGKDHNELIKILSNLQYNNIIRAINENPAPVITSTRLKQHIYSLIDNKEKFHFGLAENIQEELPGFNNTELARQYELAGKPDKAYLIWNEEIDGAQKLSAYSYIRGILTHLLEININETSKNEVRYKLSETLYKLSDYNAALNIIEQIKIDSLSKDKLLELYIMKGSAMINSGRIEEGKELIKSLIPKVADEYRKSKLLVEIAYAKFDLNNFVEASEMCNEILERQQVTDEDRGRLHNLLGMCYHYNENDSRSALIQFEKALSCYEKEGLLSKVAAIEVNIGVMNNIIGNKDLAEASWNKALNINRSIGNLVQEGLLLLNNGVHYFENINFVVAIDYYKRAHNIFLSLGNMKNRGLALSNLGEVYFIICEYQNAFEALEESKIILGESDNLEEFIPVLVLLAHFHFTIGNLKDLTNLNNETLKLLENSEVKKKYKSEIMLLNNLSLIATGKEIQIEDLKVIRDKYFDKEDLKNYVTVNIILLNYLIQSKKISEATDELNKLRFIEVCEKNNIYNASREYLLGEVSSLNGLNDPSSSIEHYEKAYELLSDESIVELTWKVLFALSAAYTDRGNFDKAKNFIIYTRDLINSIAENIETTQFKTAYLQKEERLKAMQKLEKIQVV
ncbi:MAG: protein kinase [Bacteroidetes bacterium]|nr:protein kinase [Bacteroidota bacterium]